MADLVTAASPAQRELFSFVWRRVKASSEGAARVMAHLSQLATNNVSFGVCVCS